jgi:hypothetical protein
MYLALRRISHWLPGAVLGCLTAACADTSSATDLHPEGPPMIEQVRLKELYTAGGITGLERIVFGFGSHPDASADDEHAVTTASPAGNKLRIIMDELLRGNNLEEIACRAVIDDDAYSRVPIGATPDDIARCAVPHDVLPSRCPGSNPLSVCVCARDGGCPAPDNSFTTPKGDSVGVLDLDLDGAADNTRFIQGAVGIRCGAIDVPIDRDMSYWTPSGNQQKPAQGGFDALGPAVVVIPLGALPTGMTCGVAFSPEVVDKDGNQVCAPPDGDITRNCTPGDTTAVQFTVAGLSFAIASAVSPTAQSRTADIVIKANVPLDPATLANLTVTEAGASYTQFTATLGLGVAANEITIHWTAAGGLAAATAYVITVPTTVTDLYHQAAAQPFQIAFTTGAT